MPVRDDPWSGPRRLDVAEAMDAPSVDVATLGRALRFIRRINAALGYTRATVGHLARLAERLPEDEPLRILDVATGSADVPVAVRRWAERAGRRVEVVGLDLHATTLDFARDHAGPAVPLVRGDALALPFADGAFDVVMTSMFLHHLPDDAAARVLREMARVASHGVIAADLLRDRRAYRWIGLFTWLAHPIVRHDARASVRQAFTMTEAKTLATEAGLRDAVVKRHFGHRFAIVAPALARYGREALAREVT